MKRGVLTRGVAESSSSTLFGNLSVVTRLRKCLKQSHVFPKGAVSHKGNANGVIKVANCKSIMQSNAREE